MNSYTLEWFVNDDGAQVSRIILSLPCSVTMAEVRKEAFSVHVVRRDKAGNVMFLKNRWNDLVPTYTRGYRTILAAYPSDSEGNPMRESDHITLELDMADAQARTIVGTLSGSEFVTCEYRVTQIAPMGEQTGLVWDEAAGIRCPQNDGWQVGYSDTADLKYAWFTPQAEGKRPLIVWFHGAGEGGEDSRISYMGNNVVVLSSEKVQGYFGGAYVLVPTCPTMWLDDGSHEYGHTGKSMYTTRLKALIDEFVASHEVDENRIVLTGCSNGGFMCMRQLVDYPGFYAGAAPMCEALYDDTITDEQMAVLAKENIWMLHAMTDGLVPPEETSAATYRRLMANGAENVHLTYIDDRPPFNAMINHGVWVQGLRDEHNYDFDGAPVLVDGKAVTRFQWLAAQTKK